MLLDIYGTDCRGLNEGVEMARIKVLIDAFSVIQTGGDTYLSNLIKRLSQNENLELILVLNREGSHRYSYLSDRMNVTTIEVIKANAALRLLYNQILFPTLIKKYKIDVLYCPADIAPFYVPCKVVVGLMHQFIYYPEIARQVLAKNMLLRSKVQAILAKISIKRADKVISLSNALKERLVTNWHIESEKIEVIYPGLGNISKTLCSFRDDMQNSDDSRNLILTVSRLSPHKNIEVLIKAYALLGTELRKRHTLVIVGQGDLLYLRRMKGLVVDYGIEDSVKFLGGVSNEVLMELFRKSIVFVFPSLLEGFGLPPLEAMGVGVPVIASNAPAIPEVCGDAAKYFEPGNVEDLHDAMLHLLNDSTERKRLAKRGELVASSFSWEKTAEETMRVFEEVIRG